MVIIRFVCLFIELHSINNMAETNEHLLVWIYSPNKWTVVGFDLLLAEKLTGIIISTANELKKLIGLSGVLPVPFFSGGEEKKTCNNSINFSTVIHTH